MSVRLSICLSACLSVCLPVCLNVCLPGCFPAIHSTQITTLFTGIDTNFLPMATRLRMLPSLHHNGRVFYRRLTSAPGLFNGYSGLRFARKLTVSSDRAGPAVAYVSTSFPEQLKGQTPKSTPQQEYRFPRKPTARLTAPWYLG